MSTSKQRLLQNPISSNQSHLYISLPPFTFLHILWIFGTGFFGLSGCLDESPFPDEINSTSMMNDRIDMMPPMADMELEEEMEQGPNGRLVTGVIGRGHWDGQGDQVRFDGMVCATLSSDRQFLYITDAFSGTVRRLNLENNQVDTLGGFPYELAVFDGPLDQARFESPRGCGSVPMQDALLVADSATVRWLDLEEMTVSTLSGRAGETGNADGLPNQTRLGYLTHDVIWSNDGEYAFLSDRSNDRLRLFVRQTQNMYAFGPLVDEEGQEVNLDGPGGLALNDQNQLFIADTFNGRLVSIDLNAFNLEEILAQEEAMQASNLTELGLESIPATIIASNLSDPQGVAVFGERAWVAGFDGLLVEINLNTGDTQELMLDLRQHKEPALGGAFAPLIFDSLREVLYYMDIDAEAVRRIDPETGVVKTLVGPSNPSGDRDGDLERARFGILYDVVGTSAGWMVADPQNGKVKQIQIQEDRVLSIISTPQTSVGFPIPPERVQGETPVALAYDPEQESLYIADISEHVIRRYHLTTQELDVVIGAVNESGDQDGTGQEARLNEPFGLDFGEDGRLYIADAGNQAIRVFDPQSNEVRTLAQGPIEPVDVLKGSNGDLYLVDGSTPAVFKAVSGRFEVWVGDLEESGPGDGVDGRFASPFALTRHPQGLILVVDSENHRIRSINPETLEIGTWVGQFARHGGWGTRDPILWEDLRLQSPNAIAFSDEKGVILSDSALILLEGDPLNLE